MQMQVEAKRLEEIITDCCTEFAENGSTLLVNDGEYLYSASLLRRMGKVDDISNLRREAARKRWENQPCKGDDGPDGCNPDANAQQSDAKKRKAKQSKEKQTKVEESRVDIFAAFAGGDADLLSALRGFETMRAKIKKPMTDDAKRRMLARLVKLSGDRDTQIAILHQSEDRCWAGVFELKDDGPSPGRREAAGAADKAAALRDLHDAFAEDGR